MCLLYWKCVQSPSKVFDPLVFFFSLFLNSALLVKLTLEDPILEQKSESGTMTCIATAATLNLSVSVCNLYDVTVCKYLCSFTS